MKYCIPLRTRLNQRIATLLLGCIGFILGCDSGDITRNNDTTESPEQIDSNRDTGQSPDTAVIEELGWDAAFRLHQGGIYGTIGDWHGAFFPATAGDDTHISPDTFAGTSALPVCVQGELTQSFSAYGGIQMNLHQGTDAEAEIEAAAIYGSEVTLSVANNSPGNVPPPLRLCLVPEPPGDPWCVLVRDTGGTYSWHSFNTNLSKPEEGKTYAGEPVTALLLKIDGVYNNTLAYDFCLNSLQISGTWTPPVAVDTDVEEDTDPDTGPWDFCNNAAKKHVIRDGVSYLISANVWGEAATNDGMCIQMYTTGFRITKQNDSTGGGEPLSYPSIIYGVKGDYDKSKDSELPKQVSQLGRVTSHWRTNATSRSGKFNASYDLWFNTSAQTPSGEPPNGAYLMIWTHSDGNPYPIGNQTASVTIDGVSYTRHSGQPGPSGAAYVAYVRNASADSVTVDLKDFIDDAASIGVLNTSHYLANVQAGFEIWSGGQGLETYDFYVTDL